MVHNVGRGISPGLPTVFVASNIPMPDDGPAAFGAAPPGIAVKMAATVTAEYIHVGPRDVATNIVISDVSGTFNAHTTGQGSRYQDQEQARLGAELFGSNHCVHARNAPLQDLFDPGNQPTYEHGLSPPWAACAGNLQPPAFTFSKERAKFFLHPTRGFALFSVQNAALRRRR